MRKRKIDVLLLARPDHSYTIYKGLLKSELKFVYSSFKLMPQWLKRFLKDPRIRYYSYDYSNCWFLTLFHIFRIRYGKENLEKYEKSLYERHLCRLLKKVEPKVIHYWPYLSLDQIREYKKKHPDVRTFADVYFPCEPWVLENIRPIMEQFGLKDELMLVEQDAKKLEKVMEFETNFLVPSQFVADTYKKYYPQKNYIIIPYGLIKWEGYRRKESKTNTDEIRRFVYAAGGVTIQKGCDFMLRFFKKHLELELHIYGNISGHQIHLFEEYTHCENIHFHGHIPKSKLQEEVAQYDAGIHLSRYDAYSLAVGEMMGAGLPVIVSDKTGIYQHVEAIGAGVVTPLVVDVIESKISEFREPSNYNRYLDNLDSYLMSEHKYYEDEIVDYYRQQLQ